MRTTIRNWLPVGTMRAYGTSEGVSKAWDERGRGKKKDLGKVSVDNKGNWEHSHPKHGSATGTGAKSLGSRIFDKVIVPLFRNVAG